MDRENVKLTFTQIQFLTRLTTNTNLTIYLFNLLLFKYILIKTYCIMWKYFFGFY